MNPDYSLAALPGGMVAWGFKGVLFVTVAPDPKWPARLVTAYENRVDASLLGRCVCGASVDDVRGVAPRQAKGKMIHEDDCDVGDERFTELVTAFRKSGGGTRGGIG